MWDTTGVAYPRAPRDGIRDALSSRRRHFNAYRIRPCYLFPTPDPPASIIVAPTKGSSETYDPIDWSCPRTSDEAESLMMVENFWESVDHRNEVEKNRITRFESGFSDVGRYPAMDNKTTVTEPAAPTNTDAALSFYLGPDTHLVVSGAAGHSDLHPRL